MYSKWTQRSIKNLNMCISRNIPSVYSVAVITAVVEGCIIPLAFRRTVFRAWNNFPAGAGLVVQSNLFLLGRNPFLPDKCLSFRIIWLHCTVKYIRAIIKILYNTTHATPEFAVKTLKRKKQWVFHSQLSENENHCYRPAAQGFSSEIWRGRRAAKFGRNLTSYMSVQHIWDLPRLMGLFLLFTCKFILKLRHCNERASQNYRPWYKKLCDWRISELIVVKRANDDLW